MFNIIIRLNIIHLYKYIIFNIYIYIRGIYSNNYNQKPKNYDFCPQILIFEIIKI